MWGPCSYFCTCRMYYYLGAVKRIQKETKLGQVGWFGAHRMHTCHIFLNASRWQKVKVMPPEPGAENDMKIPEDPFN
jgi:hypothetical protein